MTFLRVRERVRFLRVRWGAREHASPLIATIAPPFFLVTRSSQCNSYVIAIEAADFPKQCICKKTTAL